MLITTCIYFYNSLQVNDIPLYFRYVRYESESCDPAQQYAREIIMQVKECRKPIGTDFLNTFKITQYNLLDYN